MDSGSAVSLNVNLSVCTGFDDCKRPSDKEVEMHRSQSIHRWLLDVEPRVIILGAQGPTQGENNSDGATDAGRSGVNSTSNA
ncbi:hypothetical protein Purlil1_9821 [Purpureocillium lilacinum]|uniref:Uncharacterized protein n=1 Tax=Purpureocillium lilacinum TaxID=33203 RepID=A0ABR0BPN6_PURLI|nr:hypothetical protein Purlil1_9821 [Purpureocillium lilacinum]